MPSANPSIKTRDDRALACIDVNRKEKAKMVFTNIHFTAALQPGQKVSMRVKRLVARNSYEASDEVMKMARREFGTPDLYYPKVIFGDPRKLSASSASATVARNAGPEVI